MAWAEQVYGTSPSKAATAPTPPHDWYMPLPKPPERYLRNLPRERAAVAEAERVVRSRR